MAEYISKEAVINITAETGAWETQNRVRELPAADVQPVKRGRWIEVTPKHSRCSCCDVTCLIAVYPISANANYCPNCGARMDGDAE